MLIATSATSVPSPGGAASTARDVAPDGAWAVLYHQNYKHVAPPGLLTTISVSLRKS
jgi:hypothetical protein